MPQIAGATSTSAVASPAAGQRNTQQAAHARNRRFALPSARRLLNRGLPANVTIRLRNRLPLALIAIALLGEVILPDPIWVMLATSLLALLLMGYFWTRALARGVTIERRREALILLAGDELEEEFTVGNRSIVPLIWLEVQDGSTLPGYTIGRVISCGARSMVRWRTRSRCDQRGLFRLGPLALEMGDPFRLFSAHSEDDRSEPVLIYPPVVHVPELVLPPGNADAEARVYRHLQGALPAPTVREHVPSEGLRHVHWPATAHHGRLMVRERQQEPAGDIWIVLDSQWRTAADSLQAALFERIVTLAASAAVQVLNAPQRRKVGLLTATGSAGDLALVPPDNGQVQVWQILAALAPVSASDIPLPALLREARNHAGGRSTLLVVTGSAQSAAELDLALAELLRGGRRRPAASLLLVTTPESDARAASLQTLLARHETFVQVLPLDAPLATRSLIRRTRRVVKSTPTGGSYAVEVEEER